MKKAVIFAPFWRQKSHVGNHRVDRFVRWLAEDGFYVVLVRAGSVTERRPESWGIELCVRDPLGLYSDVKSDGASGKIRRPNKLRRFLAYWLFNPDPSIIWARAAAKQPEVLELAADSSFVLSSSPPESSHVGAAILAKKLKTKLIVDMRDGWLDEPLKPLLRVSRLQRWRERKLERAIIHQADKIFITSTVWKTLLEDRVPYTCTKTVVLTNGYPPSGLYEVKQARNSGSNNSLILIHSGRFTGSSLSRKVGYLLKPLLLSIGETTETGIVTLLGNLEKVDLEEINQWKPKYKNKGWVLEVKDAVPRIEMMRLLGQANGLLLLSASHAAIPSKFFEYLALKKPIFTITPKSSATWEIGERLRQVFLNDYRQPDTQVGRSFLTACKTNCSDYVVPIQFTEKRLKKIFIENI